MTAKIETDLANAELLEQAVSILQSYTAEQLDVAESVVAASAALFLSVDDEGTIGADYEAFLSLLRVAAPYTEDFIATGQEKALIVGAEAALDFLLTLIEELRDALALKTLQDTIRELSQVAASPTTQN